MLALIIAFYSCNGQLKNQVKPAPNTAPSIGQRVKGLDAKANLIYQDQRGNYWFASKDKGVYRYDGKRLTLFTTADGLVSNRIISVQEDQLGNLYFDTPKGVAKFDDQKFTSLTTEDAKIGKWQLDADDLWFSMGWNEKGPYRYDGDKLYQLTFPKNEMEATFYDKYPNASFNPYGVYTTFKDSKGHLWFGTSNFGIYHYDGKKISWFYEQQLNETPEGGDFGIRSIAEDRNGFFWICNTQYKYQLLPKDTVLDGLNPLSYQRKKGLKTKSGEIDYFLSMQKAKNGDIWMQTYDNGVWRNTGEELLHYPILVEGKEILLSSIYVDRQGEIWVGTKEHGIYQYKGNTFEKYQIKTEN